MRIHTKTVIDIESGRVLEDHFYEYDGPVDFSCGGDALAPEKEAQAQAQAQQQQQLSQMMQQYQQLSQPFWTNQLQNGMQGFNALTDYTKGTTAQAFAPAWGQLSRNLATEGSMVPSGMADQERTNLAASEGGAFDQNMANLIMQNNAAKQQAASALNPMAPASASTQSSQSVLQAPSVNPGGFGNWLGGAVSGLLGGGASIGGTAGGMSWAI